MKTLAIIKTGSTFSAIKQISGDFDDWLINGCGLVEDSFSVVKVIEGGALPSVDTLSGVILTGSPAMVTDQEPWMINLAAWIVKVLERHIPFLGICFGHQILAFAMGGEVDYHPQGREIGTVAISLTDEGQKDHLLGSLPARFMAHKSHAQSVLQLPAQAVKLAENAFESHHAFRLGNNAWGLQFHPEFSADIMKAYVREYTGDLLSAGQDVDAIKAAVCDTDEMNALLKRFMTIIQENIN
ncbi:MAG: glutamine amidotransferase [Methylococcaceae bacterium]|nr:glutamine amidotransferase [Methylococcaceae bacterium]